MLRLRCVLLLISSLIICSANSFQLRRLGGRSFPPTLLRTKIESAVPTIVEAAEHNQHNNAIVQPRGTTSNLLSSSANLLKNCIGAGVFSLSSRAIDIFPDPLANFHKVVMVVMMMTSWGLYNFNLIGKTCEITNSTSFGEAWEKSVSKESRWVVQTVVTLAPLIGCLSNTIVLTDVLKHVLVLVGIPNAIVQRRGIVVGILLSLLMPVCSITNLSALRSVSVVGLACQLVASIVLLIRILDKSYEVGGRFYSTANFRQPKIFSGVRGISQLLESTTAKWCLFASLLSYCLVTHYNAPRYFTELKSEGEQKQKDFAVMSSTSYASAAFIYVMTMLLTLKLFGTKSQPFALNTFSASDKLASVALIMFGCSVLASFPLVFFNVRQFFINLLGSKWKPFQNLTFSASVLLSFIGFLAVFVTDISIVGGFSGAIFGTSMMFVFPPLMYMGALLKRSAGQDLRNMKLVDVIQLVSHNRKYFVQLLFNSILMGCGVGLVVIGTVNNIAAAAR